MSNNPKCTCAYRPARSCEVDVHRNPPPVLDQFVDIVFDGPPSAEAGRFVEVEDHTGASVNYGTWVQREDGYWALRIQRVEMALIDELHKTRVQRDGYKTRCELYEAAANH